MTSLVTSSGVARSALLGETWYFRTRGGNVGRKPEQTSQRRLDPRLQRLSVTTHRLLAGTPVDQMTVRAGRHDRLISVLAAMPGLTERLLAEHIDDRTGHCKACPWAGRRASTCGRARSGTWPRGRTNSRPWLDRSVSALCSPR